jgi:hypothetical protein
VSRPRLSARAALPVVRATLGLTNAMLAFVAATEGLDDPRLERVCAGILASARRVDRWMRTVVPAEVADLVDPETPVQIPGTNRPRRRISRGRAPDAPPGQMG